MAEEEKKVAKKSTTPAKKTTTAKKTTSSTTKKVAKPASASAVPVKEKPVAKKVTRQNTETTSLKDKEVVLNELPQAKAKKENNKKGPSFLKVLVNGILKQNPVFIGLLGLCSSLALTTNLTNAIGMGGSVIFVLTLSNLVISLLRKLVPDEIRTPIFIVVIASFVTVVQLILNAFIPDLYESLGAFLSLIAVNCIILGRAESFASKNGPVRSIADGLGMGIGYTLTLTVLSLIRGIIGSGTIEFFSFSVKVLPASFTITPLTSAMGAFIVFAILLSLINRYKFYKEDKAKENEVNK